MKEVNKILVGLELTQTDSYVLSYLRNIAFYLKPKEIKFINIHQEELPDEIVEKFPEIVHTIDDHYIEEMVKETTNISVLDTNVTYQAIKGRVLEEILNAANQPDIDLLVIGRKNDKHDRNLHYQKIIRKAVSNILIIPEEKSTELKKILVPIDFSEYSTYSLNKAISLAEEAEAEIIIQNIYEVPTGYSKTGKSFVEFANIMEENATEACTKFLKNIDFKDVKHKEIFTLNDSGSTSKTIEDTIEDTQPDLLVLGSKGKNQFSAMLVGSTAESLIGKREIKIPVLLTRMRTQAVSFWDALKEF
jgi:nucleotide-binding universal stress UspA family protein